MNSPMTSRARCLVALTVIALGVSSTDTRVAEACSVAAPPPALVGYPEDGATGVPTDVLPIYQSERMYGALTQPDELDATRPAAGESQPSSFELVDSAGVVTPLYHGTGGGAWFVELVPPTALAPHTQYVVRTVAERSVGDGLQLSFTTGGGPNSRAPEPPLAAIEHFTFESSNPTTCSPLASGTCIRFDEPAPGEYVEEQGFLRGSSIRSSYAYLSRTPWITYFDGIQWGTPYDCIELRTRAPNGAFSEPVTLCGEDGETYDIRGSEDIACTDAGMTQDDRLVSAAPAANVPFGDRARCNMAAGSPAAPLPTLLCALPLLVLPLRRNRRRG